MNPKFRPTGPFYVLADRKARPSPADRRRPREAHAVEDADRRGHVRVSSRRTLAALAVVVAALALLALCASP